ncbi:twin-arginine translocation signal domain-containing protein [Enterovibrio paralichthyis]|uniref:twin-arginine translocation signal domain-containing protein n=1 Tax=Enterovibrio paralichthyis TaxID=2853805 RepID=UPI0006D182CC|nr:twin-arginine translocation signal domain-containing protein [Enterovibrio paralichthyis]MBV7299524.1 twin-arginine translocation signal domain-containing protein [Enterovibrio paralichthyis]
MSENKKEKGQPDTARRQFLKGMSVAAAAGAAASVVGGTAHADMVIDDAAQEKTKASGYRETQHIRDYYDTL